MMLLAKKSPESLRVNYLQINVPRGDYWQLAFWAFGNARKVMLVGAKVQFSRMRGYTMQIGKGIIGTQREFASVQENYSIPSASRAVRL